MLGQVVAHTHVGEEAYGSPVHRLGRHDATHLREQTINTDHAEKGALARRIGTGDHPDSFSGGKADAVAMHLLRGDQRVTALTNGKEFVDRRYGKAGALPFGPKAGQAVQGLDFAQRPHTGQ